MSESELLRSTCSVYRWFRWVSRLAFEGFGKARNGELTEKQNTSSVPVPTCLESGFRRFRSFPPQGGGASPVMGVSVAFSSAPRAAPKPGRSASSCRLGTKVFSRAAISRGLLR